MIGENKSYPNEGIFIKYVLDDFIHNKDLQNKELKTK